MEFTPKQIAEECGVSVRAVTKKAEQNGTKKNGGRWIFTETERKALVSHFKRNETELQEQKQNQTEQKTELPDDKTEQVPDETERNGTARFSLELIQEQMREQQKTIAALNERLAAQDDHIKSLLEINKQLTETNKALSAANAVNVAADKGELLIGKPIEEEPKKKGFFARLFG